MSKVKNREDSILLGSFPTEAMDKERASGFDIWDYKVLWCKEGEFYPYLLALSDRFTGGFIFMDSGIEELSVSDRILGLSFVVLG